MAGILLCGLVEGKKSYCYKQCWIAMMEVMRVVVVAPSVLVKRQVGDKTLARLVMNDP